jgi:hypothetical protein
MKLHSSISTKIKKQSEKIPPAASVQKRFGETDALLEKRRRRNGFRPLLLSPGPPRTVH